VLVKRFSAIANKFNTYILPGTTMERAAGKVFKSAVVLDRTGAVAGSYRKRKPVAMEHITPGTENLFIDLPQLRGKVAVLICFDIENADVRDEVLSEKPVLLLNPVHIGDASSGGDQVSDQNWRNAVSFMRRKLEKISLDHDIDIIRCDMPKPYGAGSSQAIGPWRTILCPSPSESSFVVELHPRGSKFRRFLGTEPPRPRTAPEDNTMNRLLVRTVGNSGDLRPIACCNIPAKLNQNEPTGAILISFSDGSIRCWDRAAHEFSSEKLQTIVCQSGGHIWTRLKWDNVSRSVRAETADGAAEVFQHSIFADYQYADVQIQQEATPEKFDTASSKYGPVTSKARISSSIIALGTQSGHLIFYNIATQSLHSELHLFDDAITTLEFEPRNTALYLLAIDATERFFSVEFSQNNFSALPSTVLEI
jgi:hypothetical protein